jgi:hypothetical protein
MTPEGALGKRHLPGEGEAAQRDTSSIWCSARPEARLVSRLSGVARRWQMWDESPSRS